MQSIVMKFGGTSLATRESRHGAALRTIAAIDQGLSPVVVVSAMGRKGSPYATDTLLDLLTSVDPGLCPNAREQDQVLACGEIISAAVFTQTLRSLGQEARAFGGGQAGIRTNGTFGNAAIVSIDPTTLLSCSEAGVVPVVCGFQGSYFDQELFCGEINTLGRGGSDTTAAAIGAALNAVAIEIYTDVDGIKTADPATVEDAFTLRKVSYDELAEIAHLGAKVVHPRAAEIAMSHNIPLRIKNSFSDEEGTQVIAQQEIGSPRATGVTRTGNLTYLQFDLSCCSISDRGRVQALVYETVEDCGSSLFMINLSPSSTAFGVPSSQYAEVERVLDGLVIPLGKEPERRVYLCRLAGGESAINDAQPEILAGMGEIRRITAWATRDCTIVSVVGREYLQDPAAFLNVLLCLTQRGINVIQSSDSECAFSVLVSAADAKEAVKALHESVFRS